VLGLETLISVGEVTGDTRITARIGADSGFKDDDKRTFEKQH
jgi:hypothetical protein